MTAIVFEQIQLIKKKQETDNVNQKIRAVFFPEMTQ